MDPGVFSSMEARAGIFDLVGRIPLIAHGVGLSIGNEERLDLPVSIGLQTSPSA
jgi:uncharacterized protein (UPF0276 family)